MKRGRPVSLNTLFLRCLLTTGAVMAVIVVVWWVALMRVMASGVILPASTAADGARDVVQALEVRFAPEDIPHWYRWALFDADGNVVDGQDVGGKRLDAMRRALEGKMVTQAFPYALYHRAALLADGRVCVLQYDYAAPYGSAWAQAHLPDFQTCMLVALAAMELLAVLLLTRRYARILRRDAAILTAATEAIAAKQLDAPFEGRAQVRELCAALDTIERLRTSLADSLASQWAMEQQREREIASLTHDLKTPLTIIRGNAELLGEEALEGVQREEVGAILRSAEHMQGYVERLRSLVRPAGAQEEARVCVPLSSLFDVWREAGRGLCAPAGICFEARTPQQADCVLQREAVCRAVLNMLDNAARFAPRGGRVWLQADVRGAVLAVTVCDSGPGFAAQALARAAEPFYTGDAGRSRDGHSGLGLAYARRVARAHGGALEVGNGETGARVRLTLACVRTDADTKTV